MVNFPTFDPGAIPESHRDAFQRTLELFNHPYFKVVSSEDAFVVCLLCTAEAFGERPELFLDTTIKRNPYWDRAVMIAIDVFMELYPWATQTEANKFFNRSHDWYYRKSKTVVMDTKHKDKQREALNRAQEIISYIKNPM